MASQQDMHIFITGVVGRAMGSGKFDAADILNLADAAKGAFVQVFGEVAAGEMSPYVPMKLVNEYAGPDTPPEAGNGIPAESKPFAVWQDDKAHYGGRNWDPFLGKQWPDVTWKEFVVEGKKGSEAALKALHRMADSQPQMGTQWEKNSITKIARAKAALAMIKG